MVIRVNVPDELAALARMRGLPLEEFVEQILAEQVAAHPARDAKPRTPEQVRAWLDSLAQFSNKIPPLPEVVSREWIYQDRD